MVLRRLSQAGLLSSHFGLRGGYRLKQTAFDLSLANLSEVLDGDDLLAPCARPGGPACRGCPSDGACSIRPPLVAAAQAARRAMEAIRVVDLIAERRPSPKATGDASPSEPACAA